MGCSASRSEETAVVVRCRERKELLRSAAHHRFDLAAAHVSYFRSLKDVGDALRKFVDEDIAFANNSSSSSTSLHSLDHAPGPAAGGGGGGETNQKGLKHHDHHHHHHHDQGGAFEEDLNAHGSHLDLDVSSDEDEDHNATPGMGQGEVISPNVMRGMGDGDHYHGGPFSNNTQYPYPSSYAQQGYWGGGGGGGGGGGWGGRVGGDWSGGGGGGWGGSAGGGGGWGGSAGGDWSGGGGGGWGGSAGGDWSGSGGWGGGAGGGGVDYYPHPQRGMPPPNINAYYMKKASSEARTVLQQPEPIANGYTTSYFSYPDQNGGVWGVPEAKKPQLPPPPPSPKASVWDFFNPFDAVETGFYPHTQTGYGYGSVVSSPDSDEVREREGIPKLEEETEPDELYMASTKGSERTSREGSGPTSRSRESPPELDSEGHIRSSKSGSSHKVDDGSHRSREASSEQVPSLSGSSKQVPSHGSQGSAIPESSHYHDDSSIIMSSEEDDEITESIHHPTEGNNSSNPTLVKSMDDRNVNTKGVTFDLDDTLKPDFDSSKLSSFTAVSVHGTRDLREVVAEIRDDFEVASSYGKEVALMLEVGKIPYQPSFMKVILSRIMLLVAPSASDLRDQSLQSAKLASKTVKLAKSFFADFGEDISMKHYNLSSTLDELYAWEKKLYKEVKEEEKLRLIYEKQYKRLKLLDQQGAEPGKIDAAQDSVRQLRTKLSISIKAINAISSKIHKLRDNELQPQVSELIHGMTRMWKSMLKCHRKQFQAIMESKVRTLRANTALERESSVRATHELQRELVSWCIHFGDWIRTQKSYVESLNGWLLRCLDYQKEDSADGPVPFSPGRLGAPPMFVICHDWNQALEAISESRVADAMLEFASILRQMWEKQDEEHRQRLRTEETSKDYKQWIESLQTEKVKVKVDQHTRSDKNGVSIMASENGISQLDDLKVDLDSLRKKLGEERAKHKDAIKMVHDAASTSIQGGLVPIFKALENFTREALNAHEQVRLETSQQAS